MIYSIGLTCEMYYSATSPWKPLICNFPLSYDSFLQMQSFEELARATAELGVANPGWNATKQVGEFISNVALHIEEAVAAVIVIFPNIFSSGLPAKYYLHARLASLSRAWTLKGGHNCLCPISDLFNHAEPSDIIISFHQKDRVKQKGDFTDAEIALLRPVTKGTEIFNCTNVDSLLVVFLLILVLQHTQSILVSQSFF